MRLLLAPHAPTDWNAARRYQGHTDIALSDVGRRQAAQLAARLADEPIDEIHASDLRRALETAAAFGEPRGVRPRSELRVRSDPRLRELHFGDWEGLTYEEVRQRFPDMLTVWEANVPRTAPPGGESLAQLAERVGAFLAALSGHPKTDRTVLVVAHRGSLQVLLCLALGMPPTAWWQFRLEPASLSELSFYPEGAVLIRFNDVHHLREAAHAG